MRVDDRALDRVLLAALSGQLDQVSLQVRGETGVGWDERVHRIRTGLKTARALLRLLRPALGARSWRLANEALRAAGRAFSETRDWDVILSVSRELSRRRRLAPALRGFQQTLVEGQRRSLDHVRHGDAVPRALVLLETARSHVQSAHLRGGWDGAWQGVGRVYALARRTWTDGGSTPDVDRLHELRKRSKDLRAQIQLLRSLAPRWSPRAEPLLERLADRLGEDRDFHLFGLAVRRAASLEPRRAQPVLEHVDARRRRTLPDVRPLVAKLYRERPRAFVDGTRSDFEAALGSRGLRRVAAVTAASALAAAAALWWRRGLARAGHPRSLDID